MNFIVYGKDDCPFCAAAKDLLDSTEYGYTYYTLGVDYDRTELIALLEADGHLPEKLTVPQIWVEAAGDSFYVGGFTELEKMFQDQLFK